MTETFNPIFTINNRITAGLIHIERIRGFLESATLSDAWVRKIGHRALILKAHQNTCAPDSGAGRAIAGGEPGSRGQS
jgi:hypothetical protein